MQMQSRKLCLLALAALLLVPAPGCKKDPGSAGGGAQTSGAGTGSAPAGADPAALAAGKTIYGQQGCAMCHGDDLKGKPTVAPPLAGLAANWEAAKLSQYLHDPQGYAASDPRLAASHETFSMRMPAYATIPAEDESKLITFLLSQ